jgi:hypothetical protein
MNDIFFKIIVPILIQPTPVKIVTILLSSVGMYFVCKKAGVDSWRGVVPPYNLFIFARIGRRSSALPIFVVVYGLFFLLGISLFMYNMDSVLLFLNVKPEEAPALIFSGVYIFYFVLPVMLVALLLCSPIFLAIFLLYKSVAYTFNKSSLFAVGMLFLPFMYWPRLGFDSSVYVNEDSVSTDSVSQAPSVSATSGISQ